MSFLLGSTSKIDRLMNASLVCKMEVTVGMSLSVCLTVTVGPCHAELIRVAVLRLSPLVFGLAAPTSIVPKSVGHSDKSRKQ